MAALLAVLTGTAAADLPDALGDKTPPSVEFFTENGAVKVGMPHRDLRQRDSQVNGIADDDSGIREVRVVYCPAGSDPACGPQAPAEDVESVNGAMRCRTRRTVCEFRASVPVVPGNYDAVAYAMDAAGNVGLAKITITVV